MREEARTALVGVQVTPLCCRLAKDPSHCHVVTICAF